MFLLSLRRKSVFIRKFINELWPSNLYENRELNVCNEWMGIFLLGEKLNDKSYSSQQAKIPSYILENRIKEIGFIDKKNVLDIGCGYGQWTYLMSKKNDSVFGIDVNPHRIKIAKTLFNKQVENSSPSFAVGDGLKMPFEDKSFDAIFCFGVFMFMNPKKSLQEMHRVLRKGGNLYLVTNSYGWWVHLLIKSLFTSIATSRQALKALVGKRKLLPTSFSLNLLNSYVSEAGFVVKQIGSEGEIGNPKREHSTYKKTFLRMRVTIEILAEKK